MTRTWCSGDAWEQDRGSSESIRTSLYEHRDQQGQCWLPSHQEAEEIRVAYLKGRGGGGGEGRTGWGQARRGRQRLGLTWPQGRGQLTRWKTSKFQSESRDAAGLWTVLPRDTGAWQDSKEQTLPRHRPIPASSSRTERRVRKAINTHLPPKPGRGSAAPNSFRDDSPFPLQAPHLQVNTRGTHHPWLGNCRSYYWELTGNLSSRQPVPSRRQGHF